MLKRKRIIIMLVLFMFFSMLPLYGFLDIQTEASESSEAESQMEESQSQIETGTWSSQEDDESYAHEETSEENKSNNESPSDENNSSAAVDSPITRSGTHKLDISWVDSTSNGTVTDSSLTNEPSKNTTQYATVQVDFQLSAGTSAAAGEVEIRIPYSIIDGDSLKEVSVAGTDNFEWYYDAATNEIVLTNKDSIDSSQAYLMQIVYEYLPSSVVADDDLNGASSSYIGNFDADLYISNVEVQSSNELDVEVITKIVIGKTTKSFYEKNELWQSEWGAEPTDSSDYFYLVWKITYTNTSTSSTQSYTIYMDDIIPAEYIAKGAYVIGYRYNSTTASFVSGDSYSTVTVDPSESSSSTSSWYVVIAYPRSLYIDDNLTSLNIDNTAEVELEGKYNTTAGPVEGTATYNYATVNFTYSGDSYSVSKGYNTKTNVGFINALEAGKSVTLGYESSYSFSLTANSRGYGVTYGLLDTGEYGYGAKEYTTTLIDDLIYLSGEQLVVGDYSIDSFFMYMFDEYDAYENANSGSFEGQKSTDYTSYSPIEVWYQTGGDGSGWMLLGTIIKVDASSYTFTPDGGTAQTLSSSSQVSLPSGCTGIKFVHTTNRYSVYYRPYITVSLHSTDHVKQLLEGKSSATVINIDSLIVEDADGNKVNASSASSIPGTLNSLVEQRDLDIYGDDVQHNYTTMFLEAFKVSSVITKSASTPENDGNNPQVKVTYTINAYEKIEGDKQLDWEYMKNLGVISAQNEGTFYDLLPAGAYADTSSIQVRVYSNTSSAGKVCTVESVETVNNWQGSGQTMLIIKVSYPDAGSGDNYSNTSVGSYETGFRLIYDIYYPWDSLTDYGNSLLNSVAYRSAEGELSGGKTADKSSLTLKEYFANLTDPSGSSPNDDTDKNTIYTETTTSVNVATSTNVGFSKKVNSAENALYGNSSAVYTGDTYTYQLRYRTAADITAKNIVFYDVLEENYGTNGYWKGTFVGIDTSYIESNYPNVDIKIYYSTVSSLDQDSASSPNLADTAIWSETPPADLSTVTAVAVDVSKNKDNTDFELPENSTVLCYITMAAPSDYSAYMAYNNAKCYGSMFTTPGNETTFVLSSDTTVSLLAKASFEFTKVDAADNQVLSDAEFALYEWTDTTSPSAANLVDPNAPGAWSLVDTAVSDGNGLVAFTNLTEGYYQLVETSAPAGYVTPTGQWRIEVASTGQITITAVVGSDGFAPPAFSGLGTTADPYLAGNIKIYEMPEMGGIGTSIFKILGSSLLLLGIAIAVINSSGKRRARAHS